MKYEALRKAESEGMGFNYRHETNPRCPHCGEVYDIADHEAWSLYGDEDGDTVERECGECDQEFTVTVVVSYSFSTDEQPDEDGDDAPQEKPNEFNG